MTDPNKKPASANVTEAGAVELNEAELEQAAGGATAQGDGGATRKRVFFDALVTEVTFPAAAAAKLKARDGSV